MPIRHEPCNLREWVVPQGRLFTCGRPGRGHFKSAAAKWPAQVPAPILASWVRGLPPGNPVHVVSLLGRKPTPGPSEFEPYPFRSTYELEAKPTLQEWMDNSWPTRFVVHEFPTVDTQPIPAGLLSEISSCIYTLLRRNEVVVVVDSAGCSRTGKVCKSLGLATPPAGSPCA